MGLFLDFNPFDNLLCILLGISFTVWFTLLLVFIIVPAIFGVSFGIRRLYMKTLLKIFEVSGNHLTVCRGSQMLSVCGQIRHHIRHLHMHD